MSDQIPVMAAERIGRAYAYDQVIIYARRVGEPGLEWVTTWGKDLVNCDAAGRIGEAIGRQVVKPIEERDAEILRLRSLLRRAKDAMALAGSGDGWGEIIAWTVNGSAERERGVAAAKKIVAMQRKVDAVAVEIERIAP